MTEAAAARPESSVTKKVVAIIPAYNEETTIAKIVLKTSKYVDEVIVCDDGSSDDTAPIAAAVGATVITHDQNMGKGATMRTLVSEARKRNPSAIVTLDADGQHDPDEIPRVIEPVLSGSADVVVGSRMASAEMPSDRRVGNAVLGAVTQTRSGVQVLDSQSGFRAYSPRAVEAITFKNNGMATESQTLIDAGRSNLRIVEVPISVRYESIRPKRSRITHFSQVLDYLISRTIVEAPILYLGIPGVVCVVVGVVGGVEVVEIFAKTHLIEIGTLLFSITLGLVGAMMINTSLILKFLTAKFER